MKDRAREVIHLRAGREVVFVAGEDAELVYVTYSSVGVRYGIFAEVLTSAGSIIKIAGRA